MERMISERIIKESVNMAKLITKGYTVTIRPTRGGVKITSHKEKEIKS
jgi:hypothetical protein|nr:MAG TPA: hypothetical protein [Caudoviricetes sp.]